jgi:hypothetical protein
MFEIAIYSRNSTQLVSTQGNGCFVATNCSQMLALPRRAGGLLSCRIKSPDRKFAPR